MEGYDPEELTELRRLSAQVRADCLKAVSHAGGPC